MSRRRLVPLALAVTALVAVVAVAARGRPLGSGSGNGSGLPGAFWDYVFTTILVLLLLSAGIAIYAMVAFRRETVELTASKARTARALAILLLMTTIWFVIGRHIDLEHLIHPHQSAAKAVAGLNAKGGHRIHVPQERRLRWDELALVAGLLILFAVLTALRGRAVARPTRGRAPEALAAALDESLDDLRSDHDLRRAIVAAYARMESALGAAGLPRKPSEAPLEYLERTLLALEISPEPIRRLTDLFEWARFSHHEPEPAMRDEAVDALVAVRDELRAPVPVAQ